MTDKPTAEALQRQIDHQATIAFVAVLMEEIHGLDPIKTGKLLEQFQELVHNHVGGKATPIHATANILAVAAALACLAIRQQSLPRDKMGISPDLDIHASALTFAFTDCITFVAAAPDLGDPKNDRRGVKPSDTPGTPESGQVH